MHWVHVDSSQTAALLAYGNIPAGTKGIIDTQPCSFPATANAESPATQLAPSDTHPINTTPPTLPTKAKKKLWFWPGFLLPGDPFPRNANPQILTVGLSMLSGDSKADNYLTEIFDDLQCDRIE